jgi:hypothetical protein
VFSAVTAELLLQYAVGDAANYMAHGKQHGMLALDPLTGKVSEVSAQHAGWSALHAFHAPQCVLLWPRPPCKL